MSHSTLVLSLLAPGMAVLATATASASPNILFVMADDLDFDYKQDRLAIMPNLQKYWADAGLQFVNHVAAQPVCGPSRSSLLAGRYPHNTGYKANGDLPSVNHFTAIENNTFGTWLSSAGYHTAFMGKMVNGMSSNVLSGWSRWGAFSSGIKTYNFYNASEFEVRFSGPRNEQQEGPVEIHNHLGVHQADFLPLEVEKEVIKAKAAGKPFALHVTPTMVHWGTCYGPCPGGGTDCYNSTDPHFEWHLPLWNGTKGTLSFPCDPCPTIRNAHRFDNLPVPHVPSWNASAEGGMSEYMDSFPFLSPQKAYRQDLCFRNRSSSAVDLDDMLGHMVEILREQGVLNDTYLVFTSDNGFHLGEHKLPFGKTEPYTTDTALPMYISGPGVARGEVRHHPTNHMDITRTILDLAGANDHVTGPPLDGLSFKGALGNNPVPVGSWRNFSFSEFFQRQNTWAAMHFVDGEAVARAEAEQAGRRATPASSASSALSPVSRKRTLGYSLHRWCTNDTEVYHMAEGDPWQLRNVGGNSTTPFGEQVKEQWMGTLVALSSCSGDECAHPTPVPVTPLPCYIIHKGLAGLDPFDTVGYHS